MLKIVLYTTNAILPIVLLISLGYVLKKTGLLNDAFIKSANGLVFRVFLPAQLFLNIYKIEAFSEIRWDATAFALIGIFAAFLVGILYARLLIPDPRQRGVVAQAFFRSNVAIIGIPLGQALGGAAGLAVISVVSAFSVAELNILGVIVLTIFLPREEGGKRQNSIVHGILTNPLIKSLAAGFLVLFLRSLIPTGADGTPVFTIEQNLPFLYKVISYLAQGTTPVALLMLGAQFRFEAVKRLKWQIISGVFGCNLLMPALAIGTAIILEHCGVVNFGPEIFAGLLPIFASPAAFSGAVMAREMNNDGDLAAQIIVWSNVFAIPTIFFWVALLLRLGYLTFV